MANCENCGKLFLFGGEKVDRFSFCGKSCAILGTSLIEAYQLPDPVAQPEIEKAHQSHCPLCAGSGPIDVHYSHSIWSLIYLTRWVTKRKIACRSCGVKSQIWATVSSALFGWWGFPWGILITPIQISRNLKALVFPFSTVRPTPDFERLIRLSIVERLREEKGLAQKSPAA